MAQQLSQAQVRVLAKVARQQKLDGSEVRSRNALERDGYLAPRERGMPYVTDKGIAFLAGRR